MNSRVVVRIFGVTAVAAWALLSPPVAIPSAAADPCPDTEVVFARGSGQPVGLGDVGQAFVDAVQSQVPAETVGVYPVDYPATHDYRNSAMVGLDDTTAHVQAIVANCPATNIVLGGYSQGASVMELSSNALPPQVASHIAAVALFGAPSSSYATSLWGGPLPELAPDYRPKSIALCIPDDIICAEGGNMIAHLQYVQAGMPGEAATFVANRL